MHKYSVDLNYPEETIMVFKASFSSFVDLRRKKMKIKLEIFSRIIVSQMCIMLVAFRNGGNELSDLTV